MATTANYSTTPNNGHAALTAASVGYGPAAPTNVVLAFTAGGSGSKIDDVKIQITGQILSCVVNEFISDGTNYWLINQYSLGALTQGTATPFSTYEQPYDRLTLKNGEFLYYGVTVAPTSGDVVVTVIGGDF